MVKKWLEKRLTDEKKINGIRSKMWMSFFHLSNLIKVRKKFIVWINRAEVEDNCSEKIKGCGKRMKSLWKIKKWSSAVFQSIGKSSRE